MYEHSNDYITRAEADQRYVQREGEDYKEVIRSVKRVERYLIGGLDDNGAYSVGMGVYLKAITWICGIATTIALALVIAMATKAAHI